MVTQYSIRFLPSDRQVITVQAPWRNVPCVLRVIRDIPANISEAKITRDLSTFYLDRPAGELCDQLQVFTKLDSFYDPGLFDKEGCRPGTARRGARWLSEGTYFNVYNRRGISYTTIELMTENKENLLYHLLMMMLEQPIRADTIAANASLLWDGNAYVIIQMNHHGAALEESDLVHIDRSIHDSIMAPAI